MNIYNDLILPIIESGAVIVMACVVVGEIIKRWIPNATLENKLIPTVNTILGGLLGALMPSLWVGTGTIHHIIYGAVCGFAASIVYDYVVEPIMERFSKNKSNAA